MSLLLLLLLVGELLSRSLSSPSSPSMDNGVHRVYSRDTLLALRHLGDTPPDHLPEEVREKPPDHGHIKRRRGRRGGVRQRLRRRGNKPPLPSMILSNVRSLYSKMDELRLNARYGYEYRESCVMVLTESWLHKDIPDSLIDLQGFSCVRKDRDSSSGKIRGGGICVYIKDNWCKQFTIMETVCDPDLELLCVSLRPFYLPREFGNIIICAAYVPPSGNAAKAANRLMDCAHAQLQRTPGAPLFILGDFNHCRLEPVSSGFYQYVKCSTRNNKILDKCFGNIRGAYTAKSLPPLSNSDHLTVHHIPTYRTVLKSSKPQCKLVMQWTDDSLET